MIIFDLDGTLADCEHRRKFIDPEKNEDYAFECDHSIGGIQELGWIHQTNGKAWKPDWKGFYEACDQDKSIQPVMDMFFRLLEEQNEEIEIWSGRCASVLDKTEKWLKEKLDSQFGIDPYFHWTYSLQMRPIGDSTPDDQLKEKWLDESIAEGKEIKFVFDDRPKVVRMWRRRGIFVFNCYQNEKEF